MESSTGVYTGSVFHDRRIEKEGHHGEFRYLVLGYVADTWYLVLEGHRGEFSYMVADLALKSISGGQETGPLFYRSRTITRWCLYCAYIVIALHVTNVVLYVLMRRHMSYAKASSLEIFLQ